MITTVTLNASIDKAYYMEEAIRGGEVMRVARCRNSAGGKGLNVARVAALCGSDVQATGMVGGFNGAYLEAMLNEDGISHAFFHTKGETRSCINILDPAFGSTEFLELGFTVSDEETEKFLTELFPQVIADSDVITMSGSAPKGMPVDIYARMVKIAREAGKQVILDTSGSYLKEGLTAKPTMVKPNRDELEALTGKTITSAADTERLAREMHESGIPVVVISLGGEGALMICEEGTYQAVPPKVDAVNTVGCGDSMVAAFAVAMEQKLPAPEALRYAVAVASANACSPDTGRYDPAVRDEILQKVVVNKR